MATSKQMNLIGIKKNQAGIAGYLTDDPEFKQEFADQDWAFQDSTLWDNEQVGMVLEFLQNKINKIRG